MKKISTLILAVIIIACTVPMALAESNDYKVGDIIQFGSYPQSKVTDEALLDKLNALAPEWEDWTSYEYYSGNDKYGSMVSGDWMRYVDINYDNNMYRAVMFTQYRANYVYGSPENSYQDDNGYLKNNVYWFKFEPIDWRILDPSAGLLICESIIDSQPFNNTIYYNPNANNSTYKYFSDSEFQIYANDYANSSIRKWLNNEFYNAAFNYKEQDLINITNLNNNGYYTSTGKTGYELLDSETTNDKIFLLSYSEAINSNYGFNSSYADNDPARLAKGTDYAKNQGLWSYKDKNSIYDGYAYTGLRTPGYQSEFCCKIYISGSVYYYFSTAQTITGVRPALKVADLSKLNHEHCYSSTITKESTHLEEGVETFTCECGETYTESTAKLTNHTYDKVVTAPTCTSKGYTTHTCECGDSYVDDYTDKIDHEYTSETTKEPTHKEEGVKTYTCACGDSYTEAIGKNLEHTYKASKITDPTCENAGYTTYICECGESRNDDFIPEKGHTYSGQMCTSCGKKCSCNCHKSGFMGFIWKIVLFFNKLFKTNKTCTCGVTHY